ncbi:MAG: glycosyltransferase [Pseudomonadota bacterium]
MKRATPAPRVAYLTSEYPTVTHTFILREIAALRTLGFDVEACSIRRPGPTQLRGPAERAEAARTFYVIEAAMRLWPLIAAQAAFFRTPKRYLGALRTAWQMRAGGAKALLYQMFYFAEATVLARHLRAAGIDHLHNHFAMSSANVAVLAARIAGIPFSFTLHGPADLAEPERWRLGLKAAEATFVACISQYARSQLERYADEADWPKFRIVHCGVTPEDFDAPLPENGAAAAFVFVGRLAPVKGVDVLLEAFARARQTVPRIQLTIIGDGPERVRLEAQAEPMGDAVRFTGYLSQAEVAELLAEADGLVLASHAEGVPVVLMEAMAAGRAVIATDITGVPELVEDGVSGFLVPASDPVAFASRMAEVAQDPVLRQRLGAEGKARVRAAFDIRIEAARLGSLFAGTAGDTVRPPPYIPPR